MRPIDPNRIELMDPAMKEMLRNKTSIDCIRMVADCNQSARLRMAGHLKTIHPEWTNEQIQTRVAQWLMSSSMPSSSNS
jgi:hypothetical protein